MVQRMGRGYRVELVFENYIYIVGVKGVIIRRCPLSRVIVYYVPKVAS